MKIKTNHRLIFGDAENMKELEDKSIHLVVTSPPYFNAPFDYPDLFESYEAYLNKMRKIAKELRRETILIFQNGKFDYKKVSKELKERSKIDVKEFQQNKWYLTKWNITNVLPLNNRIEKGIAAFPEEIPYRLIKLFSYVGETVLDPFMGSGTTNKVAAMLDRNSVGYEIDMELCEVVKEKMGLKQNSLFERNYKVEIIIREEAKHLRTYLQEKIKKQKSVVKNAKRKTTEFV